MTTLGGLVGPVIEEGADDKDGRVEDTQAADNEEAPATVGAQSTYPLKR